MPADRTTIVVQRYLDAMAGDAKAETLVRELLDQAVRRLRSRSVTAACRDVIRAAV